MNNLQLQRQGPTLLITLNRPQALNALNSALLDELSDAIESLYQDNSLRGAILTGAGEKAFAAGADIQEFQALDAARGEALSRRGQALFARIEQSPKPVIAAVNGFALGGGCELAMSCHLRVASSNAKFGQPEVKLGLIAGYGGTQRLVRHIGRGKATELLITADMIGAEEALRLGLVNYVTAPDALLEKCHEILGKSYMQSPLAVALTLEAIAAAYGDDSGYDAEARLFGQSIASEDGQEGARAFIEKRKPNFTGK